MKICFFKKVEDKMNNFLKFIREILYKFEALLREREFERKIVIVKEFYFHFMSSNLCKKKCSLCIG